MVKTTSYSPTNKRFRSHFQDFASTKAKKGHLNNNERDTDEIKHERGVLVKIEKNKIDSNGWIVEVGQGENKKTYECSNVTGVLSVPDSTETDLYYIPTYTVDVDVTIDTVSAIYQITRIKSVNNHVAYQKDGELVLTNSDNMLGEEEDEESSKLTIAKKGVTIDGDNIVNGNITANNLSVGRTFKVGKLDVGITIERLEKENQTLTQQNKQMKEDIEKLKSQIKPLVGE